MSALFFGFDYSGFYQGTPAERLKVLPAAMEWILRQEDSMKRLMKAVSELSKAFALSVPHERAAGPHDSNDTDLGSATVSS